MGFGLLVCEAKMTDYELLGGACPERSEVFGIEKDPGFFASLRMTQGGRWLTRRLFQPKGRCRRSVLV